ncbi:MAG: hypothetical protein ACRDS0_33975, partial [Pseudonocardiaceae bacterium]
LWSGHRMPTRLPYLSALVLLLPGCSGTEPDGVDAGSFRARLAGAAAGSLAGPSSAGVVYTEETPDGLFTIRMYQPEGSVTRAITVGCPGMAAPAPGSHSLDPAVEGCVGRYTRFTLEPTLELLEEVEATEGTVRLQQQSADGRMVGTFEFSGVLVRGTDSLGAVQASGSFNAIAAP